MLSVVSTHLQGASFHTWPAPLGSVHEKLWVGFRGKVEEISQILAAAVSDDTHCDWLALQVTDGVSDVLFILKSKKR